MVNKQYKFHLIYRVTNLLNNKYYIGMHSTDELQDGYLGSGKIIKASVAKYGKENFKFEILEYLPDRKSLKLREAEIVNKEEINNKFCMNLQLGGGGGFINEEHAYKFHAAGGKKVRQMFAERHRSRLKNDSEYRSNWIKKIKENHKDVWSGRQHSEESKQKMREAKQGKGLKEANSQFGTCWINKGVEVKKIKKEDLTSYIEAGWSSGRKRKPTYPR